MTLSLLRARYVQPSPTSNQRRWKEREREKKRREESEDSGQRGGSARRDKRRKKKGKKKDIASSVDKIQTEIEEGQCIM